MSRLRVEEALLARDRRYGTSRAPLASAAVRIARTVTCGLAVASWTACGSVRPSGHLTSDAGAPSIDASARDPGVATRDAGDATHDAVVQRSDASDAAGDACAPTFEPRGTTAIVAATDVSGEFPALLITSFAIDCAGLYYTTNDGALYACPAGGCNGAPQSIPLDAGGLGAGDPLVAIGGDGLYFTNGENTEYDGGRGGVAAKFFTLRRDGTGLRFLADIDDGDLNWEQNVCGASQIEPVAGGVDALLGCGDMAGGPYNVIVARIVPSDAGAGVVSRVDAGEFPASSPPGSVPEAGQTFFTFAVLGGGVAYEVLETVASPYFATLTAATLDAGSVSWDAGASSVSAITASPSFVAWLSGPLIGDAGAAIDAGGGGVVRICAGPPCANAQVVAGIGGSTVTGLYAAGATLFFTDDAGYLYECDHPLSGSCTPAIVGQAPSELFTLTVVADHVYLQTMTTIVRIAL